MSTQVLRLRRAEKGKADQRVLLQVSQTGKPLNLNFIGTEQESPYKGTIKDSSAKSLQTSKFTGSLDEWKQILRFAFFHERPEGAPSGLLEGVEAVGAVSGSNLIITIRKNIGGIHQNLGSINLEKDEDLEIDLFGWIDQAVATSDDLRTELETLQASVSGQQEQVAKLNQQLDDLVKAKKEHEDELLKNFAALLNTKKLKIRDQQRLLDGAKVDPEAARAVSEVRKSSGAKGRKAAASSNGKRKVTKGAEPNDDEDDEEDLPIYGQDALNDDDGQQEETPPHSDEEETQDEDDLDNMNDVAAVAGPSKTTANGRNSRNDISQKMDVDESEELPPKRALPFARKDAEAAKQPDPPPAAGGGNDDDKEEEEEEEETDDEL